MGDNTAYGLVVGVGNYQDEKIPKLRFTAADAESFYKQLVDPQRSGFDRDHVRLLLNEQATRRSIEKAIGGWLFQNATSDSTVIVFFAGHGALESDRTGNERDGVSKYLLPWDTDSEDLFSSALSNSRFQELLNTIKAQRLVVFLDACHAGGVSKAGARDVSIVEGPGRKIAEGRGRMVIASAHPNQRSWEDESFGHGIFTHHLLEAIDGKADADDDGCVSVMDIFRYLQDTVPATARRISNSIQEPELFGDQISRDLVLMVNRERLLESTRKREEQKRMRSAQVMEKRRKLLEFHEQGMPLDTFRQALELVEKAPADLAPEDKKMAGLLDALLEGKISLEIYLGFAVAKPATRELSNEAAAASSSGPATSPKPSSLVPKAYRREVTRPDLPAAHKVEPPKLRYCINCGTQLIPSKKFCIGCGSSCAQ
jgi:uncharacterized caspase-like protein